MPKITFISHDGDTNIVDADIGQSVMEAAIQNDVEGIDADCGGACACATCHVYLDEQWRKKAGSAGEIEKEMLEIVENVDERSRLACQVEMTDELDGLQVITPESQ